MDAKEKVRKRENVLIGAHVRAEFSVWWRHDDIEKEAKSLESRCKEFNEFIRDHRSQDDVSLHVEREYVDMCSGCGHEWESSEFEEDGRAYIGCSWCGAELATDDALALEEKS